MGLQCQPSRPQYRAASAAFGTAAPCAEAQDAGLPPEVCCHTFRATGTTNYLQHGGTIETTRTNQLYDRTDDEVTPDEIERIRICTPRCKSTPEGIPIGGLNRRCPAQEARIEVSK